MTKKKSEPNPIETAIGDRARTPQDLKPVAKTKEDLKEVAKTLDEPSPSEMLNLEELNRQTEARLQDQYPEEETLPKVPVSKPDPQPVTKTSSPESPPPQKIEITPCDCRENDNDSIVHITSSEPLLGSPPPQKLEHIDEYQDAEKSPTMAGLLGQKMNEAVKTPAEDIELAALRKYIFEDGFVLANVTFHIVTLCSEPLVTPTFTTWDFRDRDKIPDMVFALLNQPGYLEGIWPSLKIVMGSNAGNPAWCAGISTTIAFFDVIRTLPALKELSK
jgi:hypothetical protein